MLIASQYRFEMFDNNIINTPNGTVHATIHPKPIESILYINFFFLSVRFQRTAENSVSAKKKKTLSRHKTKKAGAIDTHVFFSFSVHFFLLLFLRFRFCFQCVARWSFIGSILLHFNFLVCFPFRYNIYNICIIIWVLMVLNQVLCQCADRLFRNAIVEWDSFSYLILVG